MLEIFCIILLAINAIILIYFISMLRFVRDIEYNTRKLLEKSND